MPLHLTLFSDFTCPFSYVTEVGLHSVVAGDDVRTAFRAYELARTPEELAALGPEDPVAVEDLARQLDLELRRPTHRPSTRKAHEASAFARAAGRELELRHAIYRAYWSDDENIGRIDVLAGLAGGVGIDPEEMRIALDIDRFAPEVLRDLEVAGRLRVPGTPTLFLGTGAHARVVVGSRTPAELQDLIRDTISKGGDASNDG